MDSSEEKLDTLLAALGHAFADRALVRRAMTHRSFANETQRGERVDNERLEFLGDAALGFFAAELLCERFPEAAEGELTRRRADLVSEGALADVARQLGVGEALLLGRGEERSGGRDKPRLLASALEACVGAVLLDGGSAAARDVVRRVLEQRVAAQLPGALDFKSRAQELAQSKRLTAPRYEVLETRGPDHERKFVVGIFLGERLVAQGTGRSKLEAEQAAAQAALDDDSAFGEDAT